MKKSLLCAGMILLSGAVAGQSLGEDFEGSSGIPDGWTVRNNTATTYTWSVAQYSSDNVLKSISGFTSGGNNAMMANSGRNSKGAPDSWLISPKVAVEEGDVLNFMMGYNCAYNNTPTVADENKTKFEILVSETGTEEADFTETLYSITPDGLKNWSNYSFDMEKFAGKEIYIAFREYGNTAQFPYVSNNLYIDNVFVNKAKSSDLSVVSVYGLVSGCETVQTVKAAISNEGFGIGSFMVNYQIDEEPVVTETADLYIDGGRVAEYEFSKKAVLLQGVAHSVKVWVTSDADSNHENDAATTDVVIGEEIDYPFIMTADNAQTAFRGTANRELGSTTYGWAYYNDDTAKGWKYTYYRNLKSYLLSNCIMLPKGKVKVLFDYKALTAANLDVYLVSEYEKYENVVGSMQLPVSESYSSVDMTLEIPEDGIYSLAFALPNYQSQLYLDNIQIKDPYDDMVAVSIDSPNLNAMLAKAGVTVKASFKNNSEKALVNVPVAFSVDGGTAVIETIPNIEAGETLPYTFAGTADLSTPGTHGIKVWASLPNDGNPVNDAKTMIVASYNAYAFPYQTSFESGESVSDDWIRHNPDADYVYWTIEQVVNQVDGGTINYAKDGSYAAYINSASGVAHNDYLISPAINATAGNARISFYYTTKMTSSSGSGGCNLKVYLSKTDNPADMELSNPLAVETLTNDNVLRYTQGYAWVQVPEDGIYYLVFYNDGMGHDIILDDVRFDRAEDLCMLSVENSATSGFDLAENAVTVKFENHGTTSRENIPLSYSVNGGAPVTEIYTGSVAPGAEAVHTFAAKADLSASGTYVITATVSDTEDADNFNDSWTASEIKHYETATIPYSMDFESDEGREVWKSGEGWTLAVNMLFGNLAAYEGSCGVSHSGATANSEGDCVYSGGIHIPAGTYDVSFFYRTYMNQTDAARYGQSFEVLLCDAPEAGAASIPVYKAEADIVSTKHYKKVIAPVTVEESGTYYLCVKCTTATSMGGLYMDMFSIDLPVSEGLSLGEYQSDFASEENEWYHYSPNTNVFNQWVPVSDNDGTFMQTSYSIMDFMDPTKELPDVYVAPVFNLKNGDKIAAELEYSIAFDNAGNLSDEEKAKAQIGLYLADADLPSS